MRSQDRTAALPKWGIDDAYRLSISDGECSSSVSKALLLLDAFARPESAILGVSDLSRMCGLSKATTHRLLKALERSALVERRGVKYVLGWHLFQLGQTAAWSAYGELRDAALPALEELFEEVRETVHLAVLKGPYVLYLEKITGPWGTHIPTQVGARMPAHCTALGKALLAFSEPDAARRILGRRSLPRATCRTIVYPLLLERHLDDVREEGVAYDFEESRVGLTCVAAPILDEKGLAIGAVSLAGPTSRFRPRKAAPYALRAAHSIQQEVGSRAVSYRELCS